MNFWNIFQEDKSDCCCHKQELSKGNRQHFGPSFPADRNPPIVNGPRDCCSRRLGAAHTAIYTRALCSARLSVNGTVARCVTQTSSESPRQTDFRSSAQTKAISNIFFLVSLVRSFCAARFCLNFKESGHSCSGRNRFNSQGAHSDVLSVIVDAIICFWLHLLVQCSLHLRQMSFGFASLARCNRGPIRLIRFT